PQSRESFVVFAEKTTRDLQRALTAQFGVRVARDAACDAMAYAWQHWDRVGQMKNPKGYLYRAACHYALGYRSKGGPAGEPALSEATDFDPGLVPALSELSDAQRTVVYLVDGCGWTLT